MNRAPKNTTETERSTRDRAWALADRPWLRRLISFCLVWHLVAVAVAPFAIMVGPREQPPGGGPSRPTVSGTEPPRSAEREGAAAEERHQVAIQRLEENVFRWYLNALYLNHGYSFFAPDPGPSFIMEYEVHREDGAAVRGRLPDLEKHWPRLLYHRYFMLASQNPDLVMGAVAREKVESGSTRSLDYAIARHLNQKFNGGRTVLRLVMHRLLWPEEVLAGKSPNAPHTFIPQGELVYPPASAAEGRESPDSPPIEEVQP